jgi:hypothetical protein
MPDIEEKLEEEMEERSSRNDKRESIGELINSIDKYISDLESGEITFLTPENVQGLEEALVYQNNLENIFGWHVDAIQKLIETKLIFTKSIDGRMINKKIEALSVLKADIQAHIEPGLTDRLMGITGREKI